MQRTHNRRPIAPSDLLDLDNAIVVSSPKLCTPEEKAIAMLVEEVERRTGIRWARQTQLPTSSPAVVVCTASDLGSLDGAQAEALLPDGDTSAAEGYRIRVVNLPQQAGDPEEAYSDAESRTHRPDVLTGCPGQAGDSLEETPTVYVIGNDTRGMTFGVGGLLRALRMRRGQVSLPRDTCITTAPHYALRGHQLGYRDKTNSYCGWDLAQWEQYMGDLVVFGANAIELIPPRSDDEPTSIHFPLPPLETMVGMSRIADDYGLDVWIWFPLMHEDYADPATVQQAFEEWDPIFELLPRIDALFVPGGDPGHAEPRVLMPLLERLTARLRQSHPQAQMWVSPQGFSGEWMEQFLDYLGGEPAWLTGIVFGPWVHVLIAEFRDRIPGRYPIRHYPDITHSLSCQYPVPNWDIAYALTEGRESINPRPHGQAVIFRYAQPHTVGFLTYSEGCNDDVNKCIWSALGWDPDREVIDILREYSRYYLGDRYSVDFARGLLALERNWQGPLLANTGVYATLEQFQAMEAAASPHDLKNWRFQQALYRAYYDAYVRSRLLYETALEEQAMGILRQASQKGSLQAMSEAERVLAQAHEPVARDWRTRIFQLAEALFQSIHMQLSVRLYGAQSEVRGANLDGIDYPLNDSPWLRARFAAIRQLDDEAERLAAIDAVLNWTNPGPGGFYDDLSDDARRPHLVPGLPFEEDPAFLRSPLRKFSYRRTPREARRSWKSHTGSLGDTPFEMRYPDLDPEARYRVRVVYSQEHAQVRVRLEANEGIEVHPYVLKARPRGPMEFDVPHEATRGGQLTLRWYREPGHGGSGTGCDISEIWLIKGP